MMESQSLEWEAARSKKYPEQAFSDYERIIIDRSPAEVDDTSGADGQARAAQHSQEQSLTFGEWHSRSGS